jgi:hypothetical protein
VKRFQASVCRYSLHQIQFPIRSQTYVFSSGNTLYLSVFYIHCSFMQYLIKAQILKLGEVSYRLSVEITFLRKFNVHTCRS